jgi:hypothetical protein
MLYATGTLNDLTFNDEPIQGSTLIKELKLSESSVIEFRVDQSRINVDVIGNRNVPILTTLPPQCSLNINRPGVRCSLTLRYATQRTAVPGGGFKYVPDRITIFTGETLLLNKDEELDLYTYFLVHPLNGDSPAYKNNSQPLYRVYDRQIESQARMVFVKQQSEVMNEIFRMDGTQLEIKCRGLYYRGRNGALAMVPVGILHDELRLHLNTLLAQDGELFVNAWRDQSSNLRGQIMVALDKGIIVSKTGPGGSVTYYWSEAHGGGELVSAMESESTTALMLYFQQNYAALGPKLANSISTEQMADVVLPSAPEVESVRDLSEQALMKYDNEKLVTMALFYDAIALNRETLEVKLMETDGSESKHVLYQAKELKNWKDEFTKALKGPNFVPIKKHMIQAIQAKAAYTDPGETGNAPKNLVKNK